MSVSQLTGGGRMGTSWQASAVRSVGTAGGYTGCMPRYIVNKDAVRHARALIDDGKYDAEASWSEAAPSTDDANEELKDEDWKGFAEWHLGINPDANEKTKKRYAFPYGDFERVIRSALIHAKQRASQNDHADVEKAADELLQYLDDKRS